MTHHDPTFSASASPVDDRTYNVLQALMSTLESIDAYEMYMQEETDGGLFGELLEDERRHATRLLDELRACIVPGGG